MLAATPTACPTPLSNPSALPALAAPPTPLDPAALESEMATLSAHLDAAIHGKKPELA